MSEPEDRYEDPHAECAAEIKRLNTENEAKQRIIVGLRDQRRGVELETQDMRLVVDAAEAWRAAYPDGETEGLLAIAVDTYRNNAGVVGVVGLKQ